MARKIQGAKLAPEVNGNGKVTNRRSIPELVLPHLLQLRPQPAKILPPKRRLEITIEPEPRAEIPSPVKIIHTV